MAHNQPGSYTQPHSQASSGPVRVKTFLETKTRGGNSVSDTDKLSLRPGLALIATAAGGFQSACESESRRGRPTVTVGFVELEEHRYCRPTKSGRDRGGRDDVRAQAVVICPAQA